MSTKISGTKEWAVKNINWELGCRAGCKYCYAQAMAIRFGRATPDSWQKPMLNEAKVNKDYRHSEGRIMVPTSHDFNEEHLDESLDVLIKLLRAKNELLIVSKPRMNCIERLCHDLAGYKKQILFRFTIGSADDQVLKIWEPGASSFRERLECLRFAYRAGYQTSVSSEPMLDANIDAVIRQACPFVTDAIWLGKANRLRQILAMTCPGDTQMRAEADNLMRMMTDDHIRGLFSRYQRDPKIKWKESLKKILGLERPTEKGLDV